MLVYADENLEVIHRRGSSPYLLVTFNEMEMQANGSRFWGQRFCERPASPHSASSAGGRTGFRRQAWSRRSKLRLRSLRKRRNASSTAIRKAAMRLCVIAGVSAQASPLLLPADLDRSEDRTIRQPLRPPLRSGPPHEHGNRPDQAAGRAYLFYDPFHAVDRWHAERIAAIQSETHLIPVHMTGHGTVRAFTGTARALSLIEACRADDRAGLRALARSARIGAPMRPYQIAIAAIARHPPGPTGSFNASEKGFHLWSG